MEGLAAFPFLLPQGTVLRVFNPNSPFAQSIFDLGVVVAIILGAIFVIVTGATVFSLMRFRWREGEADPKQIAGNKKVEIVWTLIPLGIVIVLFFLTARTMLHSDPAPAAEPDLVVTGHQWWWEARYTASGAVVANEFHIPVGKPFSIRLEASDVLHEFWVPELARKITAVPGKPNHLWIQADQEGTYLGICSEFCGTAHALMHFLIVVESQEEFEAWEQAQLQPAVEPTGESALEGRALFERKSCVNCHSIDGTPAEGKVGPDLTHLASRRQIGAGVVENTPDNLGRWLKNTQQVKPGAKMPDFKFSDEEINQLVDYLNTLE